MQTIQCVGKRAVGKSDKVAPNNVLALRTKPSSKTIKSKPDVTIATHPQWFTQKGELKWKVAPSQVAVVANQTGSGDWIEKWQSPKTGKWVHNYTACFIAQRAAQKFDKNQTFAQKLLKLRKTVVQDIAGQNKQSKQSKQSVAAIAVALIDRAFFRVGNEESEANGVYGTTTLLKKHVHISGDKITFDFVGKKRVAQHKTLKDAHLARELTKLLKGKGGNDRVFSFAGKAIEACDVNAYLSRFGATAKMFRTYHATRMAREHLLKAGKPIAGERHQIVKDTFEKVAQELGHTPAVCKQSYIDPRIVDAFLTGTLK